MAPSALVLTVCVGFDMGLHCNCNYMGHAYIAHGSMRLDDPYKILE